MLGIQALSSLGLTLGSLRCSRGTLLALVAMRSTVVALGCCWRMLHAMMRQGQQVTMSLLSLPLVVTGL